MSRLSLVILLLAGCGRPMEKAADTATVPSWASEIIWYQIFPERFRNGDPSNDPGRESLPNPGRFPDSWTTSEWTSDWYHRSEWEMVSSDDFYQTVRDRRYGGDLQGVVDQLDYLENLGITGIYFNPLFWARSEHKYDGSTYHHIDPYFGPDPQGDFELMASESSDPATWHVTAADSLFFSLVDQAHQRGIRVIIDGVFNHTGQEFFAFADLYERQQESPYADWFQVLSWDDPDTPENEFDWRGWWGYKPLPEFADLPDGSDIQPGPKAYIFDATKRWMDPNGDGDVSDGVDGWRLDVVADVPNGFWADWNAHVRSINPEAYTVAELWEDASQTIEEGGFSATMNYLGFAFPTKGFLIDGRMRASAFAQALDQSRTAHSPAVAYAVQNLIDSHDTERVASMITNASRQLPYRRDDWEIWWDYDWGEVGTPASDSTYMLRSPTSDERAIQRLVALFQMTYVGAPMVYYGTEAGMWGGDDPDDRQPMVWYDLQYADRASDPLGREREAVELRFDANLHLYYRQVFGLRRSHRSLTRGEFVLIGTDDESQTIAFARTFEDELLVVAINRSDEAQIVRVPRTRFELGEGRGLYPVFVSTGEAGDIPVIAEGTDVTIRIPRLSGVALIRTGIE